LCLQLLLWLLLWKNNLISRTLLIRRRLILHLPLIVVLVIVTLRRELTPGRTGWNI
jgi:hypothetical protein